MSKQPSTAELLQQLLAIEALRLADEQKKRQEAAEQQDAAAAEDEQAAQEKAKKEAEAEQKAAEEKAKKKLEESQKAAAADLGAVATGLGKLSGSTVAFPEKSVFRDGRASAAALHAAAAKVGGVVGRVSGAGSKRVLLTSRTDQLQTILAAASFAEAVKMLLKLAALELRPLPVYPPAVPPTVAMDAAAEEAAAEAVAEAAAEEAAAAAEAADVSSVVGGAVDAAVALFNLLSVETTVESSSRNATELETQVPVLAALLVGEAKVVHETIALPTPNPALQRDFATLATKPALLNAVAERSAAAIKGLGDKPDPVHLSTLTARKEDAKALSTQISDFVTKAQTPDADTKITPLGGALAAQRVIGGPDSPTQLVAIVQPARISADQIALKRRLFAPRVVVSAVATIDVVVLDVATGLIAAAESCVGEHVFQVRFPMGWWSRNEWRPHHETLALAEDPLPSDLNDITRLSRRVEALEAAGTVPPPA